jgi:hypothetical protein
VGVGETCPYYDPLWGEEFLVETKKTKVVKNDKVDEFNKDEQIRRLQAELDATKEAQSLTIESELAQLQDLSNRHSLNAMPFREKHHQVVFLYKELGQRMGPFHPDNAADIMKRWSRKGYRVYTKPRTDEQVNQYKKTDIYKQRMVERQERQDRRMRSEKNKRRNANQMAQEIARETGKAVVNELINAKDSNKQ